MAKTTEKDKKKRKYRFSMPKGHAEENLQSGTMNNRTLLRVMALLLHYWPAPYSHN